MQKSLREEAGRQSDAIVVAAALDAWTALTTIQDHGLGQSLPCAVERAVPDQDASNLSSDSISSQVSDFVTKSLR